jgi:hypothetical protein
VLTDNTVTVNSVQLLDGTGLASNYSLASGQTATAHITPKALTATATASDKVYNGDTVAQASLALNGLVGSETLGSQTGASFNSKDVLTANTVTVNSIQLADGANGGLASNYSIVAGQTATAHITPKAVTVSGITASDKVYDAGTLATVSTTGASGFLAQDDVVVTATGQFVDKNAGQAKTVLLSSQYSGADVANYLITDQASTTASISPRSLQVVSTSAADKVFDGNTQAQVSGGALQGVLAGDVVTLSQSGQFADAAAGSNKPVTVANTLAGADAGNYSVGPVSSSANILPNVQAQSVSDSVSTANGGSGARQALQLATGAEALGGLADAGGVTPPAGGGFVMAAIPEVSPPLASAPTPAPAPAPEAQPLAGIDLNTLAPTAAGPNADLVPPVTVDLHTQAGMVTAQGGSTVNTITPSGPTARPASAARRSGAPGAGSLLAGMGRGNGTPAAGGALALAGGGGQGGAQGGASQGGAEALPLETPATPVVESAAAVPAVTEVPVATPVASAPTGSSSSGQRALALLGAGLGLGLTGFAGVRIALARRLGRPGL